MDSFNLDHADSWIVWAAIVSPVAEITEPGFESWRIVLVDEGAVGADGSVAGDARPLAGGVEESNVDGGVRGEGVGFAGFGVGMED